VQQEAWIVNGVIRRLSEKSQDADVRNLTFVNAALSQLQHALANLVEQARVLDATDYAALQEASARLEASGRTQAGVPQESPVALSKGAEELELPVPKRHKPKLDTADLEDLKQLVPVICSIVPQYEEAVRARSPVRAIRDGAKDAPAAEKHVFNGVAGSPAKAVLSLEEKPGTRSEELSQGIYTLPLESLARPSKAKKGSFKESASEPLLPDRVSKDDLAQAAWIIEDALHGHLTEYYPTGEKGLVLRRKVDRLSTFHKLYDLAVLLLIVVMFLEVPSWCNREADSIFKWLPDLERCPPLIPGDTLRLSWIPMVPPGYTIGLEILALVTAAVSMIPQSLLRNHGITVPEAHPGPFLVIIAVLLVDLMYHALSAMEMLPHCRYRIAPYGRLALLFFYDNVRSVFRACLKSLSEFSNIVMLIMGAIGFFAWLIQIMVNDLAYERNTTRYALAGNEMGTLYGAILSLVGFLAGSGFPDNMCPLMRQYPWFGTVVFYPYLILTFVLFTQLMLAVVYNVYQDATKDELLSFFTSRREGVTKAFELAARPNKSGKHVITKHVFEDILHAMCVFPKLSKRLKKENAHVLFAALDDDGSGELELPEFLDACTVFQYQITTFPCDSIFIRKHGYKFEFLHWLIDSNVLEYTIVSVLCANGVFVCLESSNELARVEQPEIFKWLDVFFSFIYMVDVIIKLLVISWSSYWSHAANRFDFVVSIALFLAGIKTCLGIRMVKSGINQYLSVVRMLRLLALVQRIPRFGLIARCVVDLASISKDMVLLLFITITTFAAVGNQCFGGILVPGVILGLDSSDPSSTLWIKDKYDVFNFNDMWSSVQTLANFLVCGYMPEYVAALNLAFGNDYVGPLFCGLFFFVGVNLAFNIFTAFTIDVFLNLKQAHEEGEESEEDKNLAGMRKLLESRGQVLHVVMPAQVLKMNIQRAVLDIDENGEEPGEKEEEGEEDAEKDKKK